MNTKNLINNLTKQYITFLEATTIFELFEIIFNYVEILEAQPLIKNWLKNELTKKEDTQEFLQKSRTSKDLTDQERDQIYIHKILTNIWFNYGFFKAIHNAIAFNKNNKKGKKSTYAIQGLGILDRYDDLTENISRNKKIALSNDFKKLHNQILVFLDTQVTQASKSTTLRQDGIPAQSENINYNCDPKNKLGWFTFNGQEIKFEGRTSVIFYYFYTLNKVGQSEFKTYHDFKDYLKENNFDLDIGSISFRQGISDINKRIKKEIKELKGVIKLKDKPITKITETNQYKWEIQI